MMVLDGNQSKKFSILKKIKSNLVKLGKKMIFGML